MADAIASQAIAAGNLREALSMVAAHDVVVEDAAVRANLNRPHDLERLLSEPVARKQG
jgi:hypothetical protein